jgi:hypothetical protein
VIRKKILKVSINLKHVIMVLPIVAPTYTGSHVLKQLDSVFPYEIKNERVNGSEEDL